MTVEYPCRLRNAAGRPVEIHHSMSVTVLQPGEMMTMEAKDEACQPLIDAGVLTWHQPVPAKRRRGEKSRPATEESGDATDKSAAPAKATKAKNKRAAKKTAKGKGRRKTPPANDENGEATSKSAGPTKGTKSKSERAAKEPAERKRRMKTRASKDETGGSR